MPVLFMLTTTACVTKPKAEIVLPPTPERAEWKDPENLQDVALYMNYLEHLVQEWENWGERVQNIVK